MSKLQRVASLLSVLFCVAGLTPGLAHASAEGADQIGCAVAEGESELDGDVLCQRLALELGRSVVRVQDARVVRHGGALQVVRGDVEWFVAWLRDGEVSAWTRVAQQAARGHELETIVRASRTLAMRARNLDGRCVEVGRMLERANGSNDLVYPWQELYACKGHTVDLVDPWLARR